MDFFSLSKLFWLLVQPVVLLWFAGIVAAAFVLIGTGKRWPGGLLVAVMAMFGIVLFSNAGTMLVQSLESRFPAPQATSEADHAGAIILGGGFDGAVTAMRGGWSLNGAGDRFAMAVALRRRHPDMPVIISGGDAGFFSVLEADSDIAPRFFADLIGSDSGFVLEGKSRNTHENAIHVRDLIADRLDDGTGRPWLLVTSAFHMPRAMESFHAAGLPTVALPVDYRTPGTASWRFSLADPHGQMGLFSLYMREMTGLAVYRWTGRAKAL